MKRFLMIGFLSVAAQVSADEPCVAMSRGDLTRRQACVAEAVRNLGDEATMAAAVLTLDDIGGPAVPALVAALRVEKGTARAGAADALGRIGKRGARTEGVVAALVDLLRDSNENVRRQAAGALGRIGLDAAGAKAALTDLAETDQDEIVRVLAQHAVPKLVTP